MITYEVRTLKDGRWMTEFRTADQDEAIHQARELVAARHFHEIRVISEIFSEPDKIFRERVLFKHRRHNVPQRQSPKKPAAAPRFAALRPPPPKSRFAWLWELLRS